MEQEPKKESPELKNYSNFLNLGDFDPEPIIKKCAESGEYKRIAISALEDRIRKEENPELFDDEYRKILAKASEISRKIKGVSSLGEEMINDFLKDKKITDIDFINGLNLFELRNFIHDGLIFFDKRLSSTILALTDGNFEYLQGFLTSIREQVVEIKDVIDSEKFELIPRNRQKIEAFKERLDLIKYL
ncbi:MAG: hypothetical protein R3B55_00480 [Candidatus Paceibacterota bacterium]